MNRSHINRFRSCVQWCCFMAAALVTIFSVSSCKDDAEGMGTPEITGVRVCDPTKADSLFTKASTGQMIAVIGIFFSLTVAIWVAALAMTAVGLIFFAISPLILENGRR